MKLAARLLRVVLAAALLAPSSAFAQMRASVPGAAVGTPTVVPSLGAGLSAPVLSLPSFGTLAPALSAPAFVPSVVSLAPVFAREAGSVRRGVGKGVAAAPAAPETTDALSALRDMPAGLESAPAAARRFDGARAAVEEPAEPETVTRDIADPVADDLALWFTRAAKPALKKDQVYALVRPILGSGSRRYWEKFEKGKTLRMLVAGQTMFTSRVTSARTARIDKMTRVDFEGVYAPTLLRGKSIAQLRRKLIIELNERNERTTRGQSGVVTPASEVRVVRVMPYGEAKGLPENKEEAVYEPAARVSYALPAALQGLNHMLPKVVLLDMRLFKDAVPYPLIEDMTKLMKSGVYFVLLSDKPNEAPGSVEDQLTRGLTTKQRDLISRYKMVVLSDDGNALSSFDGAFARYLPSRRFSSSEVELMGFAARQLGLTSESGSHGTKFIVYLNPGDDAAAKRDELVSTMRKMGLPTDSWQVAVDGGRTDRSVVTLRPQNLAGALPHLLESLREHEDLFVNPNDMMTISRDEALLAAARGSLQPSAFLDLQGTELADASLAALLGPYRENRPGDLAASASKITGFLYDPDRVGSDVGSGNIYMMVGHIMHAAFNWAVWKYRNGGVFPSAEETIAVAERVWTRADAERKGNILDRPGESMAGFYEIMKGRLRTMHAVAADVLKVYPIAVGTELPNMFLFDNYKKGAYESRDILRLIFDFVVARETPQGLEVVVVDFKTGQTPTLQNLEKDIQVQLYDLVVRRMWRQMPLPYGAAGALRAVSDFKIRFIYPSGGYQPILNEWSRIKYERFLRNVMNRIRKHNAPPGPRVGPPVPKTAPRPKAKGGAKAAAVKTDASRPKTADFAALELPRTVPGLKIKKKWAQLIVSGKKKIEYRTVSTNPKPFVAIIQTFTDEKPGRPAEVVAFARIEKITHAGGQYEWHLTHVTPVKPYVVPNNKPGAIIWVKDVPVKGPRRLSGR